MTELETYIQRYFGVPPEELAQIAALFHKESLPKGDFYLKRDKPCEKLSFVAEGHLRVFIKEDDKELTQWIGSKGYFLTDLYALVYEVPSRWYMQALTDTELYTISARDYNRLGELIPGWHKLERAFLTKCFAMMEERILGFISLTAEERYQLLMRQSPEIFNQVPLQYIASMLGMTPETFSRVRKKMLQ